MRKKVLTIVLALGCVLTPPAIAAVPTQAMTFDTNVATVGMTSSQEAKIQRAEEMIKGVIGSAEFQSRVLNFTYNGKKQFNNNNGLSNAKIYQKILEGAEVLKLSKNNAMDLNVKVYYQASNTVGFTSPSSSYINMNTKYFNSYTPNNVAANMTHEWLHKLGFGHAVNYSKSRDYSVPYAIGSIISQLAKNH